VQQKAPLQTGTESPHKYTATQSRPSTFFLKLQRKTHAPEFDNKKTLPCGQGLQLIGLQE
jgi:hypothetical protein